jgi:putative PIN family toxin of toxin-antitoxin system
VIVVLDTNIWISALVFAKQHGTPTRALEKAMSEDLIATCDESEKEVMRVLTDKFMWGGPRARLALETVLARSVRVKLRGTVKKCRDPHDDKFLECAELAGASLLIAGDRDLLVLGSHHKTRIITPAEYVSRNWIEEKL